MAEQGGRGGGGAGEIHGKDRKKETRREGEGGLARGL